MAVCGIFQAGRVDGGSGKWKRASIYSFSAPDL